MEKKAYETIHYEKKDRIATIILNRPDVRNAINQEMATELLEALRDFKEDKETKVAIITGSGEKIFCAGGDIAMFFEKLANDSMARYDWLVAGEEITRLLMERIEKPIIAAVNGHCLAGGLELALAVISSLRNNKYHLWIGRDRYRPDTRMGRHNPPADGPSPPGRPKR